MSYIIISLIFYSRISGLYYFQIMDIFDPDSILQSSRLYCNQFYAIFYTNVVSLMFHFYGYMYSHV